MKLIINRYSLTIFFLLILISFYFDYEYSSYLSKNYDYVGFTLNFNLLKYIIVKIVLVFFASLSFLVISRSELLYAIYVLIFLLFLMPAGILFCMKDIDAKSFISNCFLLFIFVLLSLNNFKIRSYFISTSISDFIIVVIALASFIPILLHPSFHINFNTLLLKDIYSTRADFQENSTPLLNYLMTWQIKVISPCLFVYGLVRQKYLYSIIAFLILIYIFLISGHRSVYMALFVLIFFYFFGRTILDKLSYFIVGLFGLLFIIVPLFDTILNKYLFHSLIINRIFFDQSLITHYYFDFFNGTPVYFSESMFFREFFNYPYDLPSANLIGKIYFNNPSQHANTGIIGDGYMNLGYFGVAVLSFLFSSIFLFFKSITFDKRYFGVFFLLIFDLLNNSLLSTFLTGGLWILILFSMTIMKFKNN